MAVQPAAARLRVDARLGAGGLGLARARSRRPFRRRSNHRRFSSRRTLYGFIDRQNLDGVYRTFDFAVPDATSPRRFVTTVPQQALFLMNSPFLHEQARRLAREILPERPAGDGSREPQSRPAALSPRARRDCPRSDELELATAFIAAQAELGRSAWKPGAASAARSRSSRPGNS